MALLTNTVLHLVFFFLFHVLALSHSHRERQLTDTSGFINIDCGYPTGSYYQTNGLLYTSDEKYISSGNNLGASSSFYKVDPQDLYTTVRSFPEGLRNCYTLSPLKPNNKYLIRARFMYGDYDSKDSIPVFDVYVGVNFWFTLTLGSPGSRIYYEIIYFAMADSIDVCLVNTGKGTPFISALELRPIDNSSYPASPAFSLSTWTIEDVGNMASQSGSFELQDDAYDRIWSYTLYSNWPEWRVISTTESIDVSHNNPCKVPAAVLKTACVHNDTFGNATKHVAVGDPATQFYIYWHFAELELLGSNQTREFNIIVPGYPKLGPITPKYLQSTTISSPRISLNGSTALYFTLEKTEESNLSPILNALQYYTVVDLPASPTHQQDVDAVVAIKDIRYQEFGKETLVYLRIINGMVSIVHMTKTILRE